MPHQKQQTFFFVSLHGLKIKLKVHMNDQIFQFLRELRQNNNRNWFQANKARFDILRQAFTNEVQQLIDRIALFDPEIAGTEARNCLFRIYRDIRFSPNKLPYKQHFAAYIARGGKNSERGGYYLHLEPDNSLLSGGIWCPSPGLLKCLRKDIYDNMAEFIGILENPAFKAVYPSLDGEMLKRMPAGFPADAEHGDILRHKDFCVYTPKPDSFFLQEDWIDKAVADFQLLRPFNRFLNYTVDNR